MLNFKVDSFSIENVCIILIYYMVKSIFICLTCFHFLRPSHSLSNRTNYIVQEFLNTFLLYKLL